MRALIIGLGSIGQRHVRNLRAILGDDVEIIAYRVRRLKHVVTAKLEADMNRNVEEEFSISAYSNMDDALAKEPDVAFVCNPNSMHVPLASACVQAGCDVFIEKPLSDSLEGVDDLIAAAGKHQRIAMVGYQMRFHPCLRKLAVILKEGTLGRLLTVRATIGEHIAKWHPYEDYRQAYAARASLGGGVVLSQIHECDYLYSLFGLPRRIFAIGGQWSHLEIDVEDSASTLMEYEISGRRLPIHLHQDYLQWPPSRQCEVIGDLGRAVMDLREARLTVWENGDVSPKVHSFEEFERNQLFVDEMTHFLDCVKTRRRPTVDLQEGLGSLRMALAIRASIASGQLITLE